MNTRLRLLMAAVLLAAGCASPSTPDSEASSVPPSPTDPSSPSSSASSGAAPSTSAAAKGEVTLSGVVEIMGIEGGCRALRASGNKVYELKGGDANVLKAGAQVTVHGRIREDIMTTCQIGPVLEVISSRPA
jgi:hypothetical protein